MTPHASNADLAPAIEGHGGSAAQDRGPAAPGRLLSRRGLRVALGWLWIIDAVLQLAPANFARSYPRADLLQSVMGAPNWENQLIYRIVGPFVAHWPWWNLASGLLEALIGLALVRGRWVRTALVVSSVWSALVWLTGEGLGMVPTGFAMLLFGAPGAVTLYPVLGALAWPVAARHDVSQRSWAAVWLSYWLGGAALQIPFVYPVGQMIRANFEESRAGEPSWLQHVSAAFGHVLLHHPLVGTVALAALEVLIGCGAVFDVQHRRAWLLLAVALLLTFWVGGQELGDVFTGSATDLGTAPLVILLALIAWPRRHIWQEGRLGSEAGSLFALRLDPPPSQPCSTGSEHRVAKSAT